MTATTSSRATILLLGDSVFDSRVYLRGMPDMASRLDGLLADADVRLGAVSGSRLADIERQLSAVPSAATHLVVSLGGNDLLDLGRGLAASATGMLQRLGQAGELLKEFRRRYAHACDLVAARGLRTAMCTIYEPPLGDPVLERVGAIVLGLVNGAIEEEARARGLSVVDLRSVCRLREDFFDMIHPSALGADKIATALAQWVDR